MSNATVQNFDPRIGVRTPTAVVAKPGRYARMAGGYTSRFFRLVRIWRAETAYLSSTSEMFNHPAFAEIVAMGDKAIPLIVGEITRQPDLLFGALSRITGENPVSRNAQGDVYAMVTAWIEWYRRRAK